MTDPEHYWSLFRTGLLRSAGFPFEWLEDLGSEALEDLGASIAEAHANREVARSDVLRVLWEMRGSIQPGAMNMLNRAIRRVDKYKKVSEPHASISAATASWNDEITRLDFRCAQLDTELSAVLLIEHEREMRLLLNHVAADYFKDAVLLSSPSAYEEFCRTTESQRFRHGHELAAYRFLQRFSAKNEMGGPIGPVNLIIAGSGEDNATAGSAETQYADDPVLGRVEYIAEGDGRSARRRTLLSYWAACEIGRSLTRETPDTRRKRRPYRIFGTSAPDLTEADARLLDRVDGEKDIIALGSEMGLPDDAVDAAVERLVSLGLIEDNWSAPYFTTDPGADVRELAQQIGTPEAERACRLVADVEKFAQTPFKDRTALLSAITHDFSQLTNKPAWRGSGQFYADRAVFHEEATGNIRAAWIDSKGAQRLTERLSTALDFIASLAVEERAAGQSLLAQELERRKVRELSATEVRGMERGVPAALGDRMTLRDRFLRLVDPSASWVEFSRHELVQAGLIREDLSDWPIFGNADLMLTGSGAAEEPGSIILSELHHIWPTLACQVRALYDDGDLGNHELWQIVARELAPAVPTLQEIVRKEKTSDSSACGHMVLCLDSGLPVPDAVTVPADRAVVRRWRNGFIGFHDPVSQRDLWLLPEYDTTGVNIGGLMNCAIPALALPAFTLGPYTPRIIIDGVVIQRRRWETGATDIPAVSGRVPTEREWLAIQVWRRGIGLPQYAYFLLNTERKPVYLDFSSVLSVTNFLRCLRQAQRVVLTEALPGPQRLWLRTKDGTLTSEIRTLLWRDRPDRLLRGSSKSA